MSESPSTPLKQEPVPSSTANNMIQGTTECDLSESKCGFLGIDGSWLQILASKKAYIVIYGLLGMNQAVIGAYEVASITTFEKRFKLPSTYSGMLSGAYDIGSMLATMFIAYYGSAGHKTRLVAYWAMLSSFSCLVRILPHLIYGPGEESYRAVKESSHDGIGLFNGTGKDPLCMSPYHEHENCSLNNEGSMAVLIVFIAQILLGIGCSSYYTLGATYLDDNVTKDKFPFLFGVVACVRWAGPSFGYLLGSITLNKYINPYVTPTFGTDDPRWIGSWYLGWIPIGIFELIMGICIAFFPKILPREAIRRQIHQVQRKIRTKTSFKDFLETSKRLFKNRVLMLNSASTTFYAFGTIAYWIYMPKYIETQFRKTAADASIITGSVGLVSTAVGLLVSGAIVTKLKPRATYLASWNVFTESLDVIGFLTFAFIGCQKNDMHGSVDANGSWLLNQTCNAKCDCSPTLPYAPVCAEDGSQMYFSACHAGCLGTDYRNGTKIYTNCSCVGGSGVALGGLCPIDCDREFLIFLILLSCMRFLSSTGRAGNVVIQYRSVASEDNSVSVAFTEIALCAFTFIPAPIVYGMIIDSTCQVWGYTCGEKGNCLLYYGKDLRYLLNFTASGFLFIGLLLDIGVLFNVKSLKIYDDRELVQMPSTVANGSRQEAMKNVAEKLLTEEPNELDNEENDKATTGKDNI